LLFALKNQALIDTLAICPSRYVTEVDKLSLQSSGEWPAK